MWGMSKEGDVCGACLSRGCVCGVSEEGDVCGVCLRRGRV